MPYQDFLQNWKNFSELVEQFPETGDDHLNQLIKRYIEQNLLLFNDIFATSIKNLNHLKNAKTANDVICAQARFTNEITKNLALSTQRFLNASLGQVADYNEWLKAHCDLATD